MPLNLLNAFSGCLIVGVLLGKLFTRNLADIQRKAGELPHHCAKRKQKRSHAKLLAADANQITAHQQQRDKK